MTGITSIQGNAPVRDDVKRVKELFNSIDSNCTRVQKIFTSVTRSYFDAGQIIFNWAMDYRGKISIDEAEHFFKAGRHHLNAALKIYKLFRDNPDVIDHITMQDAMRLIREKKQSEHKQLEYADDDVQLEFGWEDYFRQGPLAKVELENYRVNIPNDNEVWLIRRGISNPIKIIDVFATATDNAAVKFAHKDMLRKIQAATEEFYSVYEKTEEADGDLA